MSSVDTVKLERFAAELVQSCPAEIKYSALDFVPQMMSPKDGLIHELVFSLLLYEASLTHAIRAMKAINANLVDYNELRVCFPSELESIIGPRYPKSHDRCERLTAALNSIFKRQQELSLRHLFEMPKREAREYLSTLDGVPPFVAARVTVIALGGHAFPIDGLLAKYLTQVGILQGNSSHQAHMSCMERAVRASDSRRLYAMFEYWADHQRNTSSALDSIDDTQDAEAEPQIKHPK